MATLRDLEPIFAPSNADVEQDGMVCVPRSDPKIKYVVAFEDQIYTVPIANVWLLPKYTNRVRLPQHLVSLLQLRGTGSWRKMLQWGKIAVLRGVEGLQLYTTFKVAGVACEERILHPVPSDLVEEIFRLMAHPHKTGEFIDGKWKSGPADCTTHARNARRADIYSWTKAAQMPDHDELSPVRNGWPIARGADRVRSCTYEPVRIAQMQAQQRERLHTLVAQQMRRVVERFPQPLQNEGDARSARGRDALREAEAELFDAREHMPESVYLKISNALKRTFDQI